MLQSIILGAVFGGTMATFAVVAAVITAGIITKDFEDMDGQEYIITKDGEKIPYNEEDQE